MLLWKWKTWNFFIKSSITQTTKIFSHEPNKSPKLITNQCHVIKEPNKKK
jgi:hypothetical protein